MSVLRRGIGLGLKSDRVKETLQRAAHGSIVVDDVHEGLFVGGLLQILTWPMKPWPLTWRVVSLPRTGCVCRKPYPSLSGNRIG